MRGTEAVTVTAGKQKAAAFRAFPNTETSSGSHSASRSAQAVHAALGAAGHRLGQFAFLVLTLCFALCAGTTGANALSDDCTQINSEWSAGVTFDAASLSPGYHDLFDEYNLADGETLTWSVTGSGVLGSNTFAAFYIGDGVTWEHSESSDQVGSFSDSGSHTFSAGNTYAILQAVVNKSGASIDDPATVTMTVSCSEGSPVTITLSPAAGSLTAGQVSTAYSQTFTASGGSGSYTYAVTSGALPAGLSLNAGNGQLTGTPTTAGTANFTITATDGNNDTGDAAYSLLINAAPVTLSPAAGALTAGQVGAAYSQTFAASGGSGSYTYAVTSGALPAGLSLNTSTGEISGTPSTAGTANFTITATDGNNDTGDAAYSLLVNAAPASTVATLANLVLSQGTLSPGFASGTTSYTASVDNAVTSLTVTPTVTDANATVTVNGTSVTSGSASDTINLNVGSNTVIVVVTAQDGTTTQTYTVTVTRAGATVATLANLVLSQGTLSPGFASGTTSYTASVDNAVTSLTVTPTVTDANATVTVNGTSVTSGSASDTINLNVGSNTVTVVVTAQDGTTTQTYTVTVTRAGATVATLSNLVLSQGTLSPGFASGTTSYTASVDNAVTSLTVTPTVTDANATVTVNGNTVTSGSASDTINLNVGSNTVTVVVTAQDGTTTQTYTVTVTRAAPVSTVATLSNLVLSAGTLDPVFASGTTSYTASVENTVTTLTLTPTLSDANATVTVNGNAVLSGNASGAINLGVGDNTITIIVTAQDGVTTQTYTVVINRAASAIATLASLTLSQGELSPAFASDTLNYTTKVENSVTSVTVTPAATQPNATITVNGSAVASGSASSAINLEVGENTISVVVTAQNGTTVQTYTVTVTRAEVITLSPASGALENGIVGVSYSQTFSASGGLEPYVLVLAGNLPEGLSFADGNLTGTPVAEGSYSFTITATDANKATGQAAYSLEVKEAAASISFSPASGALPEAMAGEDYNTSISVSGGKGPYLFSISSGTLPPGMVLNVSTGALSGPLDADTEGSYSFTIQVIDANNFIASVSYTLVVQARAVTVTDKQLTLPAGAVPANIDLTAGATGGPFIAANLLAVEPSNAGTARIVNSQFAQAGGGGSAGFYLKFTPNPSYSGQVIVRFSLTSDLGISNTGNVIYNLGYNPAKAAAEIDTLVRGFVQTRQGLLASSVKVPGLRERRRMRTANEIVRTRFSPTERGVSLGFATSLEQINAAANALTPDLKAEALRLNVWLEGSASAHIRKQNDGRWGGFAMFSAGADYLLADWALLGVSFHLDRMSDPSSDGARLTGNGWLAGPYASIEIYRNVFWDTHVLIGGSSNSIDTAFWDGRFDTSRWMAGTSLSGTWQLDPVTTLSPTLRAFYLSEKVKQYGVSNSTNDAIILDGFLEQQFRISGALELARIFVLDNGLLLTPSIELTGGYAGLGASRVFGGAEAGLTLSDSSSWQINAGVKVNMESDGRSSVTAKARAGVRF
ncbi:cadherin-like beta sandwich domain-containing protein [Pannonibacter sp. CS1GBFMT1]|uniref:cadherin-like beta sandwich domain-containing protein n=1 Tax=Pannonibacter sp. CS1GBFMT1 TaxID=2003581 RepID=UPI001645031E|nr:cadherin-like beta sandwich domain-containing protein [Pannonibacter sp. CS1GBFMT1]